MNQKSIHPFLRVQVHCVLPFGPTWKKMCAIKIKLGTHHIENARMDIKILAFAKPAKPGKI
jgi:hypothetical protein